MPSVALFLITVFIITVILMNRNKAIFFIMNKKVKGDDDNAVDWG